MDQHQELVKAQDAQARQWNAERAVSQLQEAGSRELGSGISNHSFLGYEFTPLEALVLPLLASALERIDELEAQLRDPSRFP